MFTTTIDAFHDLAKIPGNNVERSMSLKVKIYFPTAESVIPTIELGTTPIQTGTANHVTTISQVSEAFWTVVGGIHTHIGTAYTAPSARDIYGFYNSYKDNPDYRNQFVFAADGSRYVMTITNPAALDSFMAKHAESAFVDSTNSWNKTTALGLEFYDTIDYLRKNQGNSSNEAYEKAFAYIISRYDIGIILSKADTNGRFTGIFVNRDPVQDQEKFNKVTVSDSCNLTLQ